MPKPEPLTMNAEKLLALAEIVQPIRGEIMEQIIEKLEPKDTDVAASLYTIAIGLMLGDVVRALSDHTGEIEGAINDCWRHSRWPMQIAIRGIQ